MATVQNAVSIALLFCLLIFSHSMLPPITRASHCRWTIQPIKPLKTFHLFILLFSQSLHNNRLTKFVQVFARHKDKWYESISHKRTLKWYDLVFSDVKDAMCVCVSVFEINDDDEKWKETSVAIFFSSANLQALFAIIILHIELIIVCSMVPKSNW